MDVHVSPVGDDRNPGSASAPLATFAAAQSLARTSAGQVGVRVVFADGTYYLPETIRFTAADSGSATSPVLYTAQNEGRAVLSGGLKLSLKWEMEADGIARAQTPAGLEIDQLYINGKRQRMARYPNAVDGQNVFDVWPLEHRGDTDKDNDALSAARVATWKNPAGGYLHGMHPALWGDMHWAIKGKKADGTLDLQGGWQNNRPAAIHNRYRFVENIREELDAPGEWFHDRTTNTLMCLPEKGVDLPSAMIEVVRLKHLVEFEGNKDRPVENVHLKGFTFRHAARTFMENKEPLLRSDWTTYRGGAVVFAGAADCAVEDCTFDQVGGNTIFVEGWNRRIVVRGCLISESGANGIAFVGRPTSVRSPLFRYEQPFQYEQIDRMPGPKSDDYPADCLVEDCLIRRSGRDEKQTAPIQISMAMEITVRHCSIYDVPRAGININEGTFGGHVIEFCDIFNTVLETGDHGSFNSWGRDRYWHPSIAEVDRQVANDPKLPTLDAVKPITLRQSRWRCDHGWDIDLDDGSSYYRIYNNLLLHGGLKMREGFGRVATNNVILNNSLHPHCWYAASEDVFKNNIVFGQYAPAGGMPADHWGKEVDYNLFASSEANRATFAAQRCDAHSVVADPEFVDAKRGDFRVKESSPALKVGFVNFPMDQFGVQKPALKAIAKTPVIPEVTIHIDLTPAAATASAMVGWHGLQLRNIGGEEFSAYGVSRESGGVAVVKVNGKGGDGFEVNDLIQSIDGRPVKSLSDLASELKKVQGRTGVQIGIVRSQTPQMLTLKSAVEPAKL